MSRSPIAPALLLLGLAIASHPAHGATGTASARGEAPAPPAPREEFQAICERLRESDNRYFGRRQMERARRDLADLEAASSSEAPREVALRGTLGRELLELGDSEGAVAELSRALELAQRTPEVAQETRLLLLSTLALAHLQAAEDANCVAHHGADSCILPLAAGGLHSLPEHSRRAGDLLLAFLKEMPRSVHSAWLLNLARRLSGDYPAGVPEAYRLPPAALTSEIPFPRWTNRAPELGLGSPDLAGGAVMDDFDGDGLLDLVSSTSDPCGPLRALRNDGRGGFEDVSAAWGLADQLGGLNLIHGDYDNDGDLDLFVPRGAWLFEHGRMRASLLRNDLDAEERPGFTDVTRAAGLAEVAAPSQTAAWGDYDGDGDLDLYVGHEALPEAPYPSQLFRNDGGGTFTDVTERAGVANLRYAKAVAWGDYDNDGDEDLFVANLADPNRLYRNDGDRDGEATFTDVAPALGLTGPDQSFASWFFDFDNDGDLDLFVADYEGPPVKVVASYFGLATEGGHPRLYRNDGGRFTDISARAGLTRPRMPMGANFGDVDGDGFPDIYLGTGDPEYESLMPNVLLVNQGGERFADATFASGLGHLQKGHGVAFGDIDGDGDIDLFHQLGGFYPGDAFANALFENPGVPADRGHRWLTLRLVGRRANRFGVGARITVRVLRKTADGEEAREIHLVAGSGGSFGGSSLRQEIGLGRADAIEEVIVRWPGSGTPQRLTGLAPDRAYEIVEGEPEARPLAPPRLSLSRSVPP